MNVQQPEAPVPITEHRAILRDVENKVMVKLAELGKSYVPVGTRVLYFVADKDGQPVGEAYRLDCGDLRLVDEAPVITVDEKEWIAIQQEREDWFVLPVDFVDELYEEARSRLKDTTKDELLVEVAGVLIGSNAIYGTGCTCNGPKKKHYAGTSAFCTGKKC